MSEQGFVWRAGFGTGLSRICQGRPAMQAPPPRITACFWERFSDGFAPAHPGVIHCPAVHVYMHERVSPVVGNWNTVYRRFRDWARGCFWAYFQCASDDPDMEMAMIDATFTERSSLGTGTDGTDNQATGESKGN